MPSYTRHVFSQTRTPAASCETSAYAQPHSPIPFTLPFLGPLLSTLYRALFQLPQTRSDPHASMAFKIRSHCSEFGGVKLSASPSVLLLHRWLPDSGTPRLAIAILAGQTPEQTMAPCCVPPGSCRRRGPEVLIHWNNGISMEGIANSVRMQLGARRAHCTFRYFSARTLQTLCGGWYFSWRLVVFLSITLARATVDADVSNYSVFIAPLTAQITTSPQQRENYTFVATLLRIDIH
ncbi:hypothetical protein EV421DRAFT_2039276 [Armillaria borealis]|uniref:Uncharacterized protein n=1 Tax=Armillaria borealis TaxID=47425 RepID=A0AA39MHL1_9AGAR|nr:hypothetical protein EV421DRAFT_2039276 [Armillaria borealis]